MDAIRFYLTEACNRACKHCFNAELRTPKHADFEKCITFFNYLHDNGVKFFKIMGGEPSVHPQFVQLFQIAQNLFESVSLFTNGVATDVLKQVSLRPTDAVTYNYDFITNTPKDWLFTNSSPYTCRAFESVIKLDTDIDKLLSRIEETIKICNKLGIICKRVNPTIDCTLNVFDPAVKDILNEKMYLFIKGLFELKVKVDCRYDHKMPLCMWEDYVLEIMDFYDIPYPSLCASPACSGLVTSHFNLVHCNQLQTKSLAIFKEDGSLIPFEEIKNWLYFESLEKRLSLKPSSCANCKHFGMTCDGGCMAHKFKH